MARGEGTDPTDLARRHSEREARRSRESHEAVAEIGPLPKVKNPKRREACRGDLHLFLTTYFPHSTGLKPFGDKQVEAISRIERCVLGGGRFLNAMPRGYVKSTIGENSTIWSTAYGHRSFVVFFGATGEDAKQSIESIKSEWQENELLFEDFPEICLAVQALEGKSQRCRSQKHLGNLTHIAWKGSTIVLPTIKVPRGWGVPGAKLNPKDLVFSEASGAIITTKGLLGSCRGMRQKRPDGRQARPDLTLIDDGQTDDSAASPPQTAKRLGYIRRSILRLGGHGRAVACVLNGTVIVEGDVVDQLADPKRHPEWQSVRVSMMPKLPDHLDSLWLGKYAEIRRTFDRESLDDQKRAHRDATAFYKKNRKKMDAGAVVSWKDIPLEDGEISAIQHAMNILIDDGEDVFASECQNEPRRPQATGVRIVRAAEEIAEKKSGLTRGVVPEWAAHVVFMIDAHANVHMWSVAAVDSTFRGSIIDYGVYPEQPTKRYTQARAKRTFQTIYAKDKLSLEEQIVRGLIELSNDLCGREWKTPNGNALPVSLGLIDTGYKQDLVATAIKRAKNPSVLMGSRGVGFGPTDKPMPEYDTSPEKVRRSGPDRKRPRWYVPAKQINGVQVVRFDAGYWKETLHARLAVPAGGAAEWTIFGTARDEHSQFSEHLTSQEPIPTTAKERTVDVWKLRPGQEDHHLDTSVGCAVAASVLGCRIAATDPPPPTTRRPRVPLGFTYADE